MGNSASKPSSDPNTTIQVFGAGLSRTGTASLAAALEILLCGPCYHGGAQMVSNGPDHVKTWIETLEHTPVKSEADRKLIDSNLKKVLKGYKSCVDLPTHLFAQEIVDLYPEAKVICTTRDPDAWWESLKPIESANWTLRSWLLWPLPTISHFPRYKAAMDHGRRAELYYLPDEPQEPGRRDWERHIKYIEGLGLSSNRLLYFNVKEGWGPLCKFLDCPIPPANVPFPRLNDGKERDKIIRTLYLAGAGAWTLIAVSVFSTSWALLRYLDNGRLK